MSSKLRPENLVALVILRVFQWDGGDKPEWSVFRDVKYRQLIRVLLERGLVTDREVRLMELF